MTPGRQVDTSWIWHPSFSEDRKDTAGLFVHFKKTVHLGDELTSGLPVPIHITADTRYKLYINTQFVSYGPVKGDQYLWFYDEIDIAPFLRQGQNIIHVVVLRFFHNTGYAPSFPRLPVGGMRMVAATTDQQYSHWFQDAASWETAIDPDRTLRIDEPEDHFLHVYEQKLGNFEWHWLSAVAHEMSTSTGNSTPWNLSPRVIPHMERKKVCFGKIHRLKSGIPNSGWEKALLLYDSVGLHLPADSHHELDLEAPEHITAFIRLFFESASPGGRVTILYSESYEEQPPMVPYLRSKGNRRDFSKGLYGPQDTYEICNNGSEVIEPFHWRTFRFIRLIIDTGSSGLSFAGIDVEVVKYPLSNIATVETGDELQKMMWDTSIRTLNNCMHDCYEDCPFYEQLQYAMDTRSSALFTYYATGDDRLARQAIRQIHNSYRPSVGLTCSRAPSHKPQIIPNFSLYWILMVHDHLRFFDDRQFIKPFMSVVDAVLDYFHSRIDNHLGLSVSDRGPGVWNFVDWASEWQPYGIPPAAAETGISTYTNFLYAYTLRKAADLQTVVGRPSLAGEYNERATAVIEATRRHCYDGHLFTDSMLDKSQRSQQSQIWAVISGAVNGSAAGSLLRRCLDPKEGMVVTSTAMSFYTLRALSEAGIYDGYFHEFWEPWTRQLELGVTTWEEDSVSQRSDCHAWGCAPIYEYTAEVIGLQPVKGWDEFVFSPRVGLYKTLSACVPLGGPGGEVRGTAHVQWKPIDDIVEVELEVKMRDGSNPTVHTSCLGNETKVKTESGEKHIFLARP